MIHAAEFVIMCNIAQHSRDDAGAIVGSSSKPLMAVPGKWIERKQKKLLTSIFCTIFFIFCSAIETNGRRNRPS